MDIFEKVEDYQEQVVRNIMMNGRTSKANGIVFFGDSIIECFPLKKYFKEDNIYNCGVSGATSDLLLHLQPFAIKDYNPSKIILLVGTNDLSDTWQFDKLDIAFNIFKLIDIMQRNHEEREIVVLSPLPIEEKQKKTICRNNMQLKLLGEEIKNAIVGMDNVTYVDIYEAFLKDNTLNDEYTIDGLHLSDMGYDELYKQIKEYI